MSVIKVWFDVMRPLEKGGECIVTMLNGVQVGHRPTEQVLAAGRAIKIWYGAVRSRKNPWSNVDGALSAALNES